MKILSSLMILLLAFSASAANWYVRPSGGSGAGTSWTASWNTLQGIQWGSLSPGDTVWIAGGNYDGPCDTGSGGSAGNPIYIKRALASEGACTGAAGWNAGYDSTVYIECRDDDNSNGFIVNNDYITIDGGVAHSGFTFHLRYSWHMNVYWTGALQCYGTGIQGLTFKNALIYGNAIQYCWSGDPKGECDGTTDRSGRGMNIGAIGGYQNKDINISYVTFHTMCDPIHLGRNDGVTIDHCIFYNIGNFGGNDHPNVVYNHVEDNGPYNIIFRNNVITNAACTGFYISVDQDYPTRNPHGFYIYGNVFAHQPVNYPGTITFNTRVSQTDDIQVYNNVFDTIDAPVSSYAGTVSGQFMNNYQIDCGNGSDWALTRFNNTNTSYTSAFANYAAKNFRPTSALPGGYTLDPPFVVTDPDGNIRGDDDVWDLGAFEFVAASTAPNIVSNNIIGGALTNFSQQMTASASPTNWFASNLPQSLAIDASGLITGIVTNAVTNLTVTLRAYNSVGGDTQNVYATFYPLAAALVRSTTINNFSITPTNVTTYSTVTLSNQTGTAGSTATGIVYQVSSPFFVVGDTNWSLTQNQTKLITIGYNNSVVSTNLGYATFTTSGTPLTNSLYGYAAPLASGTSIVARAGLIIPPMTTNAANNIYNTVETDELNPNGWSWWFLSAPTPGYYKFAGTFYGTTNGSSDSIYWWFKDGWKVIDLVSNIQGFQVFITRTNKDIYGGWITNYSYTNTASGYILVGIGGRETPTYTTNVSWQFVSTLGGDITPPDTYTFDYPTNSGFTITVTNTPTGIGGDSGDSDGAMLGVWWTNNTTGVSGEATGTSPWTNYPVNLTPGNNVIYMTAVNTNSLQAVTNINVYYSPPVSGTGIVFWATNFILRPP